MAATKKANPKAVKRTTKRTAPPSELVVAHALRNSFTYSYLPGSFIHIDIKWWKSRNRSNLALVFRFMWWYARS